MSFSFQLEQTKDKARAGSFSTPHGTVKTPMFMPVGTLGSVKALDTADIHSTQADIILANTYHLYLRPGMTRLIEQGGIHQFMGWRKPVLTDSGGFQVFSLAQKYPHKNQVQMRSLHTQGKLPNIQSQSLVKISEEGVEFVSHLDGSKHFFTPEKAIEIQRQIGADIIMAFDECTPDDAEYQYARQALDRTHRWARRCREYWQEHQRFSHYNSYQALFGIVQGALYQDLRKQSAQEICDLDFDGIAIGGETIGYNMQGTKEVMSWIEHILPTEKPRYAMGLGRDPQNIIDAVVAGFDMFDCVAPTRLARNGSLYYGELVFPNNKTWKEVNEDGKAAFRPLFESPYAKGRLQIGNACFARDSQPISSNCDCYTCQQGYSRAYLNHLFKMKELTYYRLASIHNVRFMIRLCQQLREYIVKYICCLLFEKKLLEKKDTLEIERHIVLEKVGKVKRTFYTWCEILWGVFCLLELCCWWSGGCYFCIFFV